MFKDDLTRRELENQMKKEGRIPPGQSLTLKFPVLTYGGNPKFDLTNWDFKVWGEVDTRMKWTWDGLMALPQKSIKVDIHCVTRWSMVDTHWTGVDILELAKLVGVRSSAKYVIAHCDGGYTTNLPIEDFLDDDVLLAHTYEGEPITPDHGAPLRTLVPKLYFWKSAKFVRGLEFSTVDKPGFWEQGGYHNHGDPFKEERYAPRNTFFFR